MVRATQWLFRSESKRRNRFGKIFYITYNQTETATNANQTAARLAGLRDVMKVKRIDIVAVGRAGLWALLGRALEPVNGRVVIDCNAFKNADDKAFLEKLYSPGLRRAGDLKTAAMLVAPSPLCLFNTGDTFKTDEIAKGFQSVKAELRIEKGTLSPDEIAKWLAKESK